jgi:transcriptional regulator GlxA family with amidase domain
LTFCDMTKTEARAQNVGVLLVPGFALMSYTAAIEPLRAANLIAGTELYRWWHASPSGKPVAASNGVAIIPDYGTDRDRAADMVFVCAGGNPATFEDKAAFAWLRRLARKGVVIGGISGGPYILAKAGLLEGRRATLHWEHLPAFREAFPDVEVVPSLFEIDGNRITCSGGISALDMMVALIERNHGRQLAASVGDWFLHTHIREGMGPQRMDLRYRLCARGWHLAAPTRTAVPPPYPARNPWPLSLLAAGTGAPALARDHPPRPRRGSGYRLRLFEPVRPGLSTRLRRAAERDAGERLKLLVEVINASTGSC